jgi:hypothetical protein
MNPMQEENFTAGAEEAAQFPIFIYWGRAWETRRDRAWE